MPINNNALPSASDHEHGERPHEDAPTGLVHLSGETTNTTSTTTSHHSFHPISCIRCRNRHTRCDRLLPICSFCSSHHLECIYETPKKLRKNYWAECVDLNHQIVVDSSSNAVDTINTNNTATSTTTTGGALENPQIPKSKFKVYKFSVTNTGDKKKKRSRKPKIKNWEHALVSTTQQQKQQQNQQQSSNHQVQNHLTAPPPPSFEDYQECISQSIFFQLSQHLNEKLLLKSFRTDAYTYYTQYIAFGTVLLSVRTIERVYEFVDEDPTSTQLYPEDVLSLIYAIHAVNLFVFEQREVSCKSFEKSLRLLQYDPSTIEKLIQKCLLDSDLLNHNNNSVPLPIITTQQDSSVLCLSQTTTTTTTNGSGGSGNTGDTRSSSSEVYFSNNNRDHNSLFLISSRLMLSQYCLCMGLISTATHFLNEADVMLKNRFPIYRNRDYLPSRLRGTIVDPTLSLFEGLTQDEIHVLKYRLVCAVKLDDIRFFQERLIQYLGFSTPHTFEPYTRTSSTLADDPKYMFSSYVNKYIFGTALFILGMGKMDLLNLLLQPTILLKNQPNIAFLIIGVLDFNGNLLKKLTFDKFKMNESEANSFVIPTELTHKYVDLVFTFQKIFMTSYSFLVLHEVVLNYSSPFTLMNSSTNNHNRTSTADNNSMDMESVVKCMNFRNTFADELSDLFAVLPDYTIHYISIVSISVFLMAKIHHDKLMESSMTSQQQTESSSNSTAAVDPNLIRRMKNDYRVLNVLRKKFPRLFENSHHLLSFYSAIEYQLNRHQHHQHSV